VRIIAVIALHKIRNSAVKEVYEKLLQSKDEQIALLKSLVKM